MVVQGYCTQLMRPTFSIINWVQAPVLGALEPRVRPTTEKISKFDHDRSETLVPCHNTHCTFTLFEMNSTCMRLCDLNFSCLSTSITSVEVSSCQNKRRYPNPIWPTLFTFRVFKLSLCEFMTMVSLHVHKLT